MSERRSRWWLWLALICVAGLSIRLADVFYYRRHAVPGGDALYYHLGANYLVEGHGMVNPYGYIYFHKWLQGAAHPPLWILVIAAAAAVGVKSYFGQIVWGTIVGTGAVAMTGVAGREVAGRRVGLIAAGIAAVYPNYWINDGLLMSETLVLLVVAAAVYFAFRFWKDPRPLNAALLGVVSILAALTRSEMLLFVPFLVVPMTLLVRGAAVRRRLKLMGVGLAAAALTLAPWTIFNMTRFDHLEITSSELGGTLATANCNTTYYGPTIGYWSFACEAKIAPLGKGGDESDQDLHLRQEALHYISTHKSRVPFVVAARLGREFGVYAPIQQIKLDAFVESHPMVWALAGLAMYYVLFPTAVGGAVLLARRRVTIVPFVAVFANVVVQAIISFGDTRYRASLEVVLVILAGVAIDALLGNLRRKRKVGAHRRGAGAGPPGGDVATRVLSPRV